MKFSIWILLSIFIISCSVSKDKGEDEGKIPNDGVTNTTQDAQSREEEDSDGDYVSDVKEIELGTRKDIPDLPMLGTIVDSFKIFSNEKLINNLKESDESLLNLYVKKATLGNGTSFEYNFIKRSTVLTGDFEDNRYIFDEYDHCSNSCEVILRTRATVTNSLYFKEYNDFEISVKIYDKLNHQLIDLDTRVALDDLQRPIGMSLDLDAGMFFNSAEIRFKIDKNTIKYIGTGDYLVLVGISNAGIVRNKDVLTLDQLDQNVESKTRRVVLLEGDNLSEYLSSSEDGLKELIFNNSREVRFNDEELYSINDTSNTMSSWDGIKEIDSSNYEKGIWKISSEGFSRDSISGTQYYISYVTNLDRLNLAEKRYTSINITSPSYQEKLIRPYESLSIRLSKEYTKYKQRNYLKNHSTRIGTQGSRICVKTRDEVDRSSCRDPHNDRFLLNKGRCDTRTVCVAYDTTRNMSQYTCDIRMAAVDTFIDRSAFSGFESLSLSLNNKKKSIEDYFSRSNSINGRSLNIVLDNEDSRDIENLEISQERVFSKIKDGYLSDNCIRKTCAGQYWRSSCIEVQPDRSQYSVRTKFEQRNIKYEILKKEIYESDF